MIGSRKATDRVLKAAYNIGRYIALNKYIVLNGMALGIDVKALEGALSAGGKTIVSMPCGRNIVYPKTNGYLYNNILNSGCICSQYPDGTRPEKFRFIERDYMQALYADCIIVISCESGSGTMHTIRQAKLLQKPIGVIPFESSGNTEIINNNGGIWLRNYAAIKYFVKDSIIKQDKGKARG